jgi:hypothetical protein
LRRNWIIGSSGGLSFSRGGQEGERSDSRSQCGDAFDEGAAAWKRWLDVPVAVLLVRNLLHYGVLIRFVKRVVTQETVSLFILRSDTASKKSIFALNLVTLVFFFLRTISLQLRRLGLLC